MATKPEYNEIFEEANQPETENWVEIFASDWNKEEWAFYAYIDVDTYSKDIDNIGELIGELNWRDQDVYIELIDYSPYKDPVMEKFYHKLYNAGYMTHWNALNKKNWRKYFGK